jgi:hypothetical protein
MSRFTTSNVLGVLIGGLAVAAMAGCSDTGSRGAGGGPNALGTGSTGRPLDARSGGMEGTGRERAGGASGTSTGGQTSDGIRNQGGGGDTGGGAR